MIEKHVRIANELGRKVANADEAREILKIGTWYNSTEETRLKLGLPPNREGQTRSKEREVAQSMFSIRGSSILPKAVLFVIGVATNRHAQQPAQIGDELLVLGSDKTCSGVAIQDQDKTKQTTTNKTGDQKPSNPKTETSDDSPDTPDHAAQPKVPTRYVIPDVPHGWNEFDTRLFSTTRPIVAAFFASLIVAFSLK